MIEAILILGMHRSGTSCLTGCLSSYGLTLGNISNYNKYNLKGNQEDRRVFRLNESILNHNGGSWRNPVEIKSTNEEHFVKRSEVLKQYSQLSKPWGIKDPRMLLVYPFWEKFLPKHKFVGTIRHPKAVAESLVARKNLSVSEDLSYQLWSYYNRLLLEQFKKSPFPIINFDLQPTAYQKRIKQIAELLGLEEKSSSNFYDDGLKRQKSYSIEECPTHLRHQYETLLSLTL